LPEANGVTGDGEDVVVVRLKDGARETHSGTGAHNGRGLATFVFPIEKRKKYSVENQGEGQQDPKEKKKGGNKEDYSSEPPSLQSGTQQRHHS